MSGHPPGPPGAGPEPAPSSPPPPPATDGEAADARPLPPPRPAPAPSPPPIESDEPDPSPATGITTSDPATPERADDRASGHARGSAFDATLPVTSAARLTEIMFPDSASRGGSRFTEITFPGVPGADDGEPDPVRGIDDDDDRITAAGGDPGGDVDAAGGGDVDGGGGGGDAGGGGDVGDTLFGEGATDDILERLRSARRRVDIAPPDITLLATGHLDRTRDDTSADTGDTDIGVADTPRLPDRVPVTNPNDTPRLPERTSAPRPAEPGPAAAPATSDTVVPAAAAIPAAGDPTEAEVATEHPQRHATAPTPLGTDAAHAATPRATTPTATTPSDTAPTATTPSDTAPSDTAPSDTAPTATTPSDTAPSDTAPTATTPSDTASSDTAPSDAPRAATGVRPTEPATPTPPASPTTADGEPAAGPPPAAEPSTALAGLAARQAAAERPSPSLPDAGPNHRPATVPHKRSARGDRATYRSDARRSRSVHRRANPWYSQLARLVVAAVVLTALGGALYYGAQAYQDWNDRPRLPGLGVDTPTVRATTFRIDSRSPAPELDGTLTIDTVTGAFEFIGSADGDQAGWQLVSQDGRRVAIRRGDAAWRVADAGDPIAEHAIAAVTRLTKTHDPDVILPRQLRHHVDLVQEDVEVTSTGELTRYDMLFDSDAFKAVNRPEWIEYERDVIPAMVDMTALPVTIWLDRDDVVVRLTDATSGWSWERVAHLAEPFYPIDPLG